MCKAISSASMIGRGQHLRSYTALLLLIVALFGSGSSVVAARYEPINPMKVEVLTEDPAAGLTTFNGVGSVPGANTHHILSLNKPAAARAVTMTRASLVQIIDTSQFSPPSPGPTGIAYIAPSNALVIGDAEVRQTRLYTGVDLFGIALTGSLIETSSTTASSWFTVLSRGPLLAAPTGLAFNPHNGHLFVTDDQADTIFDIEPGADKIHGTVDDIITSFYSTIDFGSHDPEGIAFDSRQKTLYIADGPPGRVIKLAPGLNDFFDGPPPAGDDQVTRFDTYNMGLDDPEGIDFNPYDSTLFVVGRDLDAVLEITTGGTLVRIIDVSFLNAPSLSGVAHAPGSTTPTVMNLYITDRGMDRSTTPDENDGKVYEVALSSEIATSADELSGTSSPPDIPISILLRRLVSSHYAVR